MIRKLVAGIGLFVLTAVCLSTFGQEVHGDVVARDASAYFSGKVAGKMFCGDSIRILFLRDFLSTGGNKWEWDLTGSRCFFVRTNENGEFSFVIPRLQYPGRMQVHLVNGDDHPLLNEYIVEPGDSIFLNILKDNDTLVWSLSGHGVAKYKCMDVLRRESVQFNLVDGGTYINRIESNGYSAESFEECWANFQRYVNKCRQALVDYKSGIDSMVYHLLYFEIEALPYTGWILAMQRFYRRANVNAGHKEEIKKAYFKYYPLVHEEYSDILSRSSLYVGLILRRVIADIAFKNDRIPQAIEVYEKIKRAYSGRLREKLLCELILLPQLYRIAADDSEQWERVIDDAYKLARTPFIKASFRDQLIYRRGAAAFNFQLQDTGGNVVRLSDFKGKVVLQDVWFTGCTGCAEFHEIFKKRIYSEFKDNPDFVIVSIAGDKTRANWMKSLYSGIYTEADYVNLYTGGAGFQHPMFEYYKPNGYPFLLVIDQKGRIHSRITDFGTEYSIQRAIREALAGMNRQASTLKDP